VSTIGGAGEFELLERIKPYLAAQSGRDDAALIEEAPGFTVASTDTFVEGVHFELGWMNGEVDKVICHQVGSGRRVGAPVGQAPSITDRPFEQVVRQDGDREGHRHPKDEEWGTWQPGALLVEPKEDGPVEDVDAVADAAELAQRRPCTQRSDRTRLARREHERDGEQR